MTAEVVVMNRGGVALAADSAVSCQVGDSSRVRESALKLFMLSKHHPVGVMVYENSTLLGVPWETIIKMFREQSETTGHENLVDYGNELIKFLNGNTSLFPEEVQDKYYLQTVRVEYQRIKDRALKELADTWVYESGDFPQRLDDGFVELEISEALKFWVGKEEASYCLPEMVVEETAWQKTAEEIAGRNSGEVARLIHQVFGELEIDPKYRDMLHQVAQYLITKDEFPEELFSGLVIAGFGESEHFPSVQHIEIGGYYDGKLKVRIPQVFTVSDQNPSHVMSFAYTEMVESFLHDISNSTLDHLESAAKYMANMPTIVLEALKDVPSEKKAEVVRVIQASVDKSTEFLRTVMNDAYNRHAEVRQAVELLTINELAQVASTLVSLSSFQQQMSLGRQTVGGPVDVAVISKGDGFIWIERKHYFRAELNNHFFQSYFDGSSADGIEISTIQGEQSDDG